MSWLRNPIGEEEVRRLRIGDIVYVDGIVITARDAAHVRALKYRREGLEIPVSFEGNVLYHCGPLVKKVDDEWMVLSAGPTTSTRMEYIEAEFIEAFRPRIIVGKGGMGRKTAEALRRFGTVYASYPGGVGVSAAKSIVEVVKVEWLDLGIPEALWVFKVENFGPLIVSIDTHGNNLYEEVAAKAKKNLEAIVGGG
jgi:fumarate hydratase subunit beta